MYTGVNWPSLHHSVEIRAQRNNGKNIDTVATSAAVISKVLCFCPRSLVSLPASLTLWQGNLSAGRQSNISDPSQILTFRIILQKRVGVSFPPNMVLQHPSLALVCSTEVSSVRAEKAECQLFLVLLIFFNLMQTVSMPVYLCVC